MRQCRRVKRDIVLLNHYIWTARELNFDYALAPLDIWGRLIVKVEEQEETMVACHMSFTANVFVCWWSVEVVDVTIRVIVCVNHQVEVACAVFCYRLIWRVLKASKSCIFAGTVILKRVYLRNRIWEAWRDRVFPNNAGMRMHTLIKVPHGVHVLPILVADCFEARHLAWGIEKYFDLLWCLAGIIENWINAKVV